MKTIFVSRHVGAQAWIAGQGIKADALVSHLNMDEVQAGDVVIGSLPVSMVAEICKKRAKYFHLSISVPENMRGKELSEVEMEALGAKLIEYFVKAV